VADSGIETITSSEWKTSVALQPDAQLPESKRRSADSAVKSDPFSFLLKLFYHFKLSLSCFN
jgi:hypothetical protein